MERPINLLSVPSEISNTDRPPPGEFEGAERSQSAVTASSDQQQAGSRENLQRPLRFRYPLVSLKRLKTIGPARRVLVSNTEADESLPKPSEEENVVIQKLPAFSENEHVATSIESAASTENLSPEQGKATSSTDQRSGSAQVGGGNYELVLEYGEIDLAQMLLQKWKEIDAGNKQLDENWLRFYWQQILRAVNTIHEERIVHSDLKPANFLLVKGTLKLIDFGIAKAIQSDTTNIQRDSQVGTLNYMSPEAFMCNDQDENGNTIKCGRPSDIWSLGCILYQMVYGRTPFADFNTFWTKYKEITNKDHKITYNPVSNPWLLDIMKKCLAWNRNERLRIPQLLEHPFLQPPAPPLLLTQEEQYCKALLEISQVYGSVAEIRSLCDKLQENIRKLAKPANR